jgi:DNA-binding Xre family transcriptional regulator
MTKKSAKHPMIGSGLDDLLEEDGILEEVETAALKRTVALQIADEMKKRHLSKTNLAKRMHTSRMVVDRLLNADNDSVTLTTLGKAATALGCRLKVELEAVS